MHVFSKFYILAACILKYTQELRIFLSLGYSTIQYNTTQVYFKSKYAESTQNKSECGTVNCIIRDAGYFMM